MTITPIVPASSLSSLPSGIWSGVNGYPVLPYLPGQNVEMTKAPTYNTKVVEAASGRERRTALMAYPKWKFNLSYEVVRNKATVPELAKMWEFFNTMQGMAGTFLYVDPTNNQATTEAFAIGDGVSTTFQLYRHLNTWYEPVSAAYGLLIYDNGTLKTLSTDYTIGNNGLVTFVTAPASGHTLTWSGYFYFMCRFEQDDLSMTQIMNQLWSGPGLKFTSFLP